MKIIGYIFALVWILVGSLVALCGGAFLTMSGATELRGYGWFSFLSLITGMVLAISGIKKMSVLGESGKDEKNTANPSEDSPSPLEPSEEKRDEELERISNF